MTNDERTEERLIDEAFAALEGGLPSEGEPRAESPRDADAETLGRLYAEVLGLVAYDAPPLMPSPELRDRVLALVRGDETLEIEPGGPRAAELRTPPAQYPAPLPVPPPTFGQAPPPRRGGAARPARRSRRWPLALAAAVALASLGLSLWLFQGLAQQGAVIDRLQAELRRARERVAALEASGGAELAALRARLALVTSPAVEVTPLRRVEGEAAAPEGARGVLYVAADRQHWFLSVEGLPPAGPERDYQLWFIAGGKPVPAGTFDPAGDAPATLAAATMPAGTEVAAVTLEPAGGMAQPTGPMVLKGGTPLRIL